MACVFLSILAFVVTSNAAHDVVDCSDTANSEACSAVGTSGTALLQKSTMLSSVKTHKTNKGINEGALEHNALSSVRAASGTLSSMQQPDVNITDMALEKMIERVTEKVLSKSDETWERRIDELIAKYDAKIGAKIDEQPDIDITKEDVTQESWLPLPPVNNDTFSGEVLRMLGSRKYRDQFPVADAKIRWLARDTKPLGQPYTLTHPHYDPFWLVAHAITSFVNSTGLLLEFGVAHGSSATLAGGILKKLSNPKRQYYGFDTFTGLPEAWGQFAKGAFAYDPNGGLPPVPDNVPLIKGLFSDTLGPFLEDHSGPAAFINIDCDLYTGARGILKDLRSRVIPGTILHFHELNQPESQELRALKEWLQEEGKGVELELLNTVAWGEAAILRVVSVP